MGSNLFKGRENGERLPDYKLRFDFLFEGMRLSLAMVNSQHPILKGERMIARNKDVWIAYSHRASRCPA